MLSEITEGVEKILRTGGFFLKHLVRLEQSWKSTDGQVAISAVENRIMKLPDQMSEEDNKALGFGYI